MGVTTEFTWHKPLDTITREKLKMPNVLTFMANEAKRLMDPYVPARNMVLAQNVRIYTEGNPASGERGIVHYQSPYAHYQYAGILYVSSKTGAAWSRGEYKVPTGKKLNYSKFRHPLATSNWDKAMLTANRESLVKAVQGFIDGGGAAL